MVSEFLNDRELISALVQIIACGTIIGLICYEIIMAAVRFGGRMGEFLAAKTKLFLKSLYKRRLQE